MTDKRSLAVLAIFLLLNLCIVIFLRDSIPAVAGLYPDLPATAHWFHVHNAGLLYVLTPLVVTAAIVTLLAPGMLIILATEAAASIGELLLKGFGVSYVLHFLTTTTAKTILSGPLDSGHFIALLSATLALSYGLLVMRARRMPGMFRLFTDPHDRAQLYWLFAIPFLFIIPLLPVIFWQDLNADGFEALEIGRSLSTTVIPVFPTPAGTMGLGIGMVTMSYPIHWFIMLFGPVEAATRLPMVLFTVVLFAGLLASVEFKSRRRMRPLEQAALLLGVAGYVTAMSFNSGYDNYFTDMSSPAAYETLTILLITACCYSLWVGAGRWFLLFTILGFLARPTILLIIVLLGAGIWITAPERRRDGLLLIGTAIGIWVILLVGYENLFLPLVTEQGGPGYSGASILSRFQFLTFTDLQRFLYAAAPTGILPALALLAYRWLDPLSRCLAIVACGYFLVFYIPAFTSLHHFVPVMILPLIVFWRLVLARTDGRWPALVTASVTAVFIWLSLPNHFEIDRTFRHLGSKTAYLIGDYQGDFADYRTAIRSSGLMTAFFSSDWDISDPAREQVGGFQQLYYARTTGLPSSDINYLVLAAGAAAPEGYTLLKSDMTGSAWVRDTNEWEADRLNPPATGYRSPLYTISRETSFFFMGVPARNYDVNLSSFPLLWRLFPG